MKIEVNKVTVMSVVNSMEKGVETRREILKKHGIDVDTSQEWFDYKKWINSFSEIEEKLGPTNLLLIGRAIIKSAKFPPIKDLEEGLRSINIAYHMNHRKNGKAMCEGGKITSTGIGSYNLTGYDPIERKAVMICDNPYPSEFDRGIISQIVRKFKLAGSQERVQLDETKETRKRGGKSCTFLISW